MTSGWGGRCWSHGGREGGNDIQGGKAGIWDRDGMTFFGDGGVGGRGQRGAEREMGKGGGG